MKEEIRKKREARQKKKEEQQKLEEKKQRKEARRLKREARKKREEAKKKKQDQATFHLVNYQVALKMEMMITPTKCLRVKGRRARLRAATTTNIPSYPTIILL